MHELLDGSVSVQVLGHTFYVEISTFSRVHYF